MGDSTNKLEWLGRWLLRVVGIGGDDDSETKNPIRVVQECSDNPNGFEVVCDNMWRKDGKCKTYCEVVTRLHQLKTMGSREWTLGLDKKTAEVGKPCASTCYNQCSLCIESKPIKCEGSGQHDCPEGFGCSTHPILPEKHRRALGFMRGKCVYDSRLVDEFSLKITDNTAYLPSEMSAIILTAILMLIVCCTGMLFSCRKGKDKQSSIQDSSYILMDDG